jgi:Chitobiase/beta-hexosaminidase C-terminal domain
MGMTAAPMAAITPASGTYPTPLTVSIQDGLPGATIYVTVDGSTPTLSLPIRRGPFTITQSAKVESIAVVSGYSTSPVGVANFTLQ